MKSTTVEMSSFISPFLFPLRAMHLHCRPFESTKEESWFYGHGAAGGTALWMRSPSGFSTGTSKKHLSFYPQCHQEVSPSTSKGKNYQLCTFLGRTRKFRFQMASSCQGKGSISGSWTPEKMAWLHCPTGSQCQLNVALLFGERSSRTGRRRKWLATLSHWLRASRNCMMLGWTTLLDDWFWTKHKDVRSPILLRSAGDILWNMVSCWKLVQVWSNTSFFCGKPVNFS